MTGLPDVPDATPQDRLAEILLDPASIGRGNANIEHEREVAIYDLVEANTFVLAGRRDGPYRLQLGITEDRLVLDIAPVSGAAQGQVHLLSLTPMRRVMKDYFLVCETYYQAIRTQPPSKIQAIDMGRRALHDEGSRILVERLAGKIEVDRDTARRLFTLICALHWKG
ncbi:MAG: UPF0262 family protein [Actinomycetales bacterium]|nr:UPF0262 family protein [Actinomycetales bacterium]